MVRQGEISAGHARALLSLPDEDEMVEIAKKIPQKGYTVRDIEKMGKKAAAASDTATPGGESSPGRGNIFAQDSFYEEMALALTEQLGKKVTVSASDSGKGTLSIEFYTKDELSEMAKRLTGEQ